MQICGAGYETHAYWMKRDMYPAALGFKKHPTIVNQTRTSTKVK